MKLRVNDKDYEVVITRKRGQRNTYLRVKEDLKIYVTTNMLTPMFEIEKIIKDNQKSMIRMINQMEKRVDKNSKFIYLGKEYDVIYTSIPGISLGEEKVFMNKEVDDAYLEKWYKKEASKLFQQHLDDCYNRFSKRIPYPTLTIRKMTTRWGVCNTKDHRVTLNLELMKKPIYCLDYVIMHELSHLIHPNHSKDFHELLKKYVFDEKQKRNRLKDYCITYK